MSYENETKTFYQNDQKANEYYEWYTTAKGLNARRFRFIARKEQETVEKLLSPVPHARVIDVPAGTGKMAPVFKRMGSTVLACDVSPNMLKIAEKVYTQAGVPSQFLVVPLESATQLIRERYDAVVCVRLMHRLPLDVMEGMLSEIAKLAPYAVVSFAVTSAYERFRGRVRRTLMAAGGDGVPVHRYWPTERALESMLEKYFVIEEMSPVFRVLSSERMYRLKSLV